MNLVNLRSIVIQFILLAIEEVHFLLILHILMCGDIPLLCLCLVFIILSRLLMIIIEPLGFIGFVFLRGKELIYSKYENEEQKTYT